MCMCCVCVCVCKCVCLFVCVRMCGCTIQIACSLNVLYTYIGCLYVQSFQALLSSYNHPILFYPKVPFKLKFRHS